MRQEQSLSSRLPSMTKEEEDGAHLFLPTRAKANSGSPENKKQRKRRRER
jgi:hypothetical protein